MKQKRKEFRKRNPFLFTQHSGDEPERLLLQRQERLLPVHFGDAAGGIGVFNDGCDLEFADISPSGRKLRQRRSISLDKVPTINRSRRVPAAGMAMFASLAEKI